MHLTERVRRKAAWTPAVLVTATAAAALAGCDTMVCSASCTIGH